MLNRYYTFCLALVVGLPLAARAQQPFEQFGIKVKILSLSNGRYPEYFPNDSLRRIGTVVYDTRLKRVAYLLPADSLVGRAKSEITSRWWVVDPLAEKSAHISPYVYAQDNAVRFNDPDGREEKDVILKGSQAKAAFQQLQASVQGSLNLSMDNNGKVTYTQLHPFQNAGAKQLMSAVDDHSVNVNVTAENTKNTSTGQQYIGGAFMGNTVGKTLGPTNQTNVVETKQEVNPTVTAGIDNYYNNPGATVLHEVVESYLGGSQSQKTGVAASPNSSAYLSAHAAAPAQGGNVYGTYFDKGGNVVYSPAGTTNVPVGAVRVEYSVQQGTRPPATIMTYP